MIFFFFFFTESKVFYLIFFQTWKAPKKNQNSSYPFGISDVLSPYRRVNVKCNNKKNLNEKKLFVHYFVEQPFAAITAKSPLGWDLPFLLWPRKASVQFDECESNCEEQFASIAMCL